MKKITLDQVMNGIGLGLIIMFTALIIFNISVYGISNTASFEF